MVPTNDEKKYYYRLKKMYHCALMQYYAAYEHDDAMGAKEYLGRARELETEIGLFERSHQP